MTKIKWIIPSHVQNALRFHYTSEHVSLMKNNQVKGSMLNAYLILIFSLCYLGLSDELNLVNDCTYIYIFVFGYLKTLLCVPCTIERGLVWHIYFYLIGTAHFAAGSHWSMHYPSYFVRIPAIVNVIQASQGNIKFLVEKRHTETVYLDWMYTCMLYNHSKWKWFIRRPKLIFGSFGRFVLNHNIPYWLYIYFTREITRRDDRAVDRTQNPECNGANPKLDRWIFEKKNNQCNLIYEST